MKIEDKLVIVKDSQFLQNEIVKLLSDFQEQNKSLQPHLDNIIYECLKSATIKSMLITYKSTVSFEQMIDELDVEILFKETIK